MAASAVAYAVYLLQSWYAGNAHEARSAEVRIQRLNQVCTPHQRLPKVQRHSAGSCHSFRDNAATFFRSDESSALASFVHVRDSVQFAAKSSSRAARRANVLWSSVESDWEVVLSDTSEEREVADDARSSRGLGGEESSCASTWPFTRSSSSAGPHADTAPGLHGILCGSDMSCGMSVHREIPTAAAVSHDAALPSASTT